MTKLLENKPFIIAEIGSNFTNFQEAKDSVAFAAGCGADAVKFQVFDSKSLYGIDGDAQGLPLEWLPKLKEKADACKIEFMCSAFSPELYDEVNPYVGVHKIASSEVTYHELLEKVKSFNKPVILSVGASAKGDVGQAIGVLGNSNIVLMYCVSAYPSREFNLFMMDDLKETFGLPMGFSDHSLDVYYPALSAVHHFGAVAIEKHVNFFDHKTPDSPHSLNHHEFTLFCQVLKGKKDYKTFNPQSEEVDMFKRHNRRLIAIQEIQAGEPFRYHVNFGAFRSLKDDISGLPPAMWPKVARATAKRVIKKGDAITPKDF